MSAGMSKTSCRHSRYASRMIGNEPKRDATCRSSDARRRVCQSGERLPGKRRGSSSARPAASRKRAAKSGVSESRATTRSSRGRDPAGTPRPAAAPPPRGSARRCRRRSTGRRSRVAALAHHRADRHRPRRVHLAAERREHAHAPVADLVEVALDDDRAVVGHRAGGRVLVGEVLEQVARGALVEVVLLDRAGACLSAGSAARSDRVSAPIARPNSSGRAALSPFQNGIFPGTPGAGETSTRSCVISSTRQVDAPSRNVSP